MKKKQVLLILGMLIVAVFLAACGGAKPASKPTIKLIANSWPASELNVAVAKILLEKELGYTVEIINIDERTQWDALAAGDADASLEIWPSGHGEAIAQYINDQKVVEDGGPLGPEGIIGWYVPTYVVTEHPELAELSGYANPDIAKMFATAETGDKGAFYAGDPAWVQFDQQIIDNNGLNFQVLQAGSEDALLAQVDGAYQRKAPVLFYFYQPHAIFGKYDLTQVKLPDCTEDHQALVDAGKVNCAYPVDQLMKILSGKLAGKAPEAYAFLKAFNYTNADQNEMLDSNLNKGMSVTDAAQAWVDAHQDIWSAWLK
jgi:glycine betaine/proline transport system substrate-binding protein